MDDVLFIYGWFKKAMSSVGRRTTDPKCGDIKKTYQYRAVSKFVDKARDYGLTRDQMQALVKEIILYAKDRKLLHRGSSILNMADIFSVCAKRLELSVEATDTAIELVKQAAQEIEKYQPLHLPENPGGYPRMIVAINNGSLPVELLSLSKKCAFALQRLHQKDRDLLPSEVELLKLRVKFLMDKSNRDRLKESLGDDLLDTGVPL